MRSRLRTSTWLSPWSVLINRSTGTTITPSTTPRWCLQWTLTTPTHGTYSPSISFFSCGEIDIITITFFHMKMNLFNDEFSLFIFLTLFICLRIRPSDQCFASFAKDVTDTVKTCDKSSVFSLADCNVDTLIKEICSTYVVRMYFEIILY